METIYAYQPLSMFSNDIYTVDGSFGKSPLGRRMTVVKVGQELIIHSAIRMEDKDLLALNQLGRVSTILVPNTFHTADANFYKQKYPAARLLVPDHLTAKELKNLKVDGVITKDGGAWQKELAPLAMAGTKSKEVIFFHKLSKSLILTDLAFNFVKSDFRGVASVLMSLNKADRGLAPTRLSNYLFFQDKSALAKSLREALLWPFENIIVAHGHNLKGNGKAEFKKAFDCLLNP
ncbi:MAG TPA: hypothetical protein VE954_38305 [Oligoflexus sp.]|uniref:hypothetical protein n=1 Tax=Oligoflexus sp. TaxID=1971216 RepID=UPI002D36D6F8|nr:hypothetical protein [Oligoflexus sp.]HYX38993.1 hypothetical protein [Oligoflexus sp.]